MFITLQQYTVLAFDVNWCTSWSIIKRNYRYVYVYETHKNITINSGKRALTISDFGDLCMCLEDNP